VRKTSMRKVGGSGEGSINRVTWLTGREVGYGMGGRDGHRTGVPAGRLEEKARVLTLLLCSCFERLSRAVSIHGVLGACEHISGTESLDKEVVGQRGVCRRKLRS